VLRFDKALLVPAALTALGFAVLRLDLRSEPIDVFGYLTALLASIALASVVIVRLLNTEIAQRIMLSVGIGIVAPGCGALAFGSAGTRRWVPIGTGMASQGLFSALAGIAFTLTVALMIEMRFAGSLPRSLEQERRRVFRSFYLGGGLTTGCAIAGVCLVGDPGTPRVSRPISNTVAALFGASIYGTVVIGMLLVMLAAVPREGFKAMAASEDERLRAEGQPSRRRHVPTRRYVRQVLPAAALSIGLVLGAVFVWWIALPALLIGGTWLFHAWTSRLQTSRADEGLPLHPITFVATILVGLSLPFVAHAALPFLEPAHTQTAIHLYEVAIVILGAGYVAFAAGHPPEPLTGLLPSLHTVGVWCGIAALAGFGLTGSVFAAEQSGGWFLFWITVTATPAMLAQILLLRSPSVRA
jgi:hypothetical protein